MIIKSDKDTIISYLEDSSNLRGGYAERVLVPESEEDLVRALSEANAGKIPVTVSGGGTSTTGSRVPFGGIIISTEKFNNISEVDGRLMRCTVGSGVLVESLKSAADEADLFYTSHPTERNAFLGGTIATNASGSRSFKYGPTRKSVTRLKMALATGEIVELRRGENFFKSGGASVKTAEGRKVLIPLPSYKMPNIKNSAGYFAGEGTDAIDLFIGQEGTLSVIVEADLVLVKKPHEIFGCFAFFKSEEDSWNFCDAVKAGGFPDLLSIEYFGSKAVDILREKRSNIPAGARAAIFFEEERPKGGLLDGAQIWIKVIESSGGSVDDTWVAMNEKEALGLTELRYSIPETINEITRKSGFRKLATDIAVPKAYLREMMLFYRARLESSGLRHVVFGHIGEDHVHVNIIPSSEKEFQQAYGIALEFIGKGVSLGGTVSAEHGIGKLKHKFLEMMYGATGIAEMVKIKRALDPNCILGVGNIFPKEKLSLPL